MPNWCDNHLSITGDRMELDRFILESCTLDAQKSGFLDFEKIIPIGDVDDWYEQRIENWGTKWNLDPLDTSVEIIETEVSIWFLSAWSPPIPIMEELVTKYPALMFRLDYNEGGMAFRGIFEGRDGEVVRDDSWNMTEEEMIELDCMDEENKDEEAE